MTEILTPENLKRLEQYINEQPTYRCVGFGDAANTSEPVLKGIEVYADKNNILRLSFIGFRLYGFANTSIYFIHESQIHLASSKQWHLPDSIKQLMNKSTLVARTIQL